MKSQMNRKTFLQATLATTFTGLVACSGEEDGTGGGDGDGDMSSGGTGAGTGGAGTGGAGTGGAGTGGAGTGGAGTGGAGTGGAGTGGAGTGGAGTGGAGTGGDVGTGGDNGTGGEMGGGCAAVMTEWIDNHPEQFGLHDYDEMEVSAADVAAGVEKVYSVQGESAHPHTLTVTAEDFAALAADGMVEVMTSVDNEHSHAVVLTCSM